jgi:UDP-glucose 6-dehydrogenase
MYLDVNKNLRGYAGMCLPKDVKALRQFMMNKKINFNLIKYVDLDNKRLKKTVFKGMRK